MHLEEAKEAILTHGNGHGLLRLIGAFHGQFHVHGTIKLMRQSLRPEYEPDLLACLLKHAIRPSRGARRTGAPQASVVC
jgi:hypothetical protein